jgi:OFA family oxalate/formate antiporter-like MFS transporter
MTAASLDSHSTGIVGTRWRQLLWGIVCILAIANLQYGWTLFIKPIDQKYHWGPAAIQVAFWIFVTTETWVSALGVGRLLDRLGPKLSCISGPLVAAAWVICSFADSLLLFYFAAWLSGLGVGLVFAAAFGNAVKWFPDRRGLAAGLTAAGFNGAVAWFLEKVIQSHGYEAAFLWFGIVQGGVILAIALLLRAPRPNEIAALPSPQAVQAPRDYTFREVVTSQPFLLMFAMFAMVGAGGLMVGAQLGPVVADLGIANESASIFGLTLPVLSFSLLLTGVSNAASRPIFGWFYDRIGRAWAMFIAFFLQGVALVGQIMFASTPWLFVSFAGLVFFAWGQIFALFPAACTDIFGSKYATRNYGGLYTAKSVAAAMIPLSNVLTNATGSWTCAFVIAAGLSFVAAFLVLALEPARRRLLARSSVTP